MSYVSDQMRALAVFAFCILCVLYSIAAALLRLFKSIDWNWIFIIVPGGIVIIIGVVLLIRRKIKS